MDKSGSGFRPFHKLIPGIGVGFGTASSHFAMDDGKIELDQFLRVTAYDSMRHHLRKVEDLLVGLSHS